MLLAPLVQVGQLTSGAMEVSMDSYFIAFGLFTSEDGSSGIHSVHFKTQIRKSYIGVFLLV